MFRLSNCLWVKQILEHLFPFDNVGKYKIKCPVYKHIVYQVYYMLIYTHRPIGILYIGF